MATEENDEVEVDMSAENNITGMNSDNVVESEQQSQSYSSKQHAEMLLKLRREKRTRKTKVTKLKHQLQKLCSVKDGNIDTAQIENCVSELWEILEETQLVMDEMSSLYLQMNDMKLHKEIMQESDNLEIEIQQTIDCAQNMLVASPQVLEKDNPVDTESVLLTGGNDLSTESDNNLQTEVQTPSHQDPTPSSQAPIPPGTQTTTLLIRTLVPRPQFHLVLRLRPFLIRTLVPRPQFHLVLRLRPFLIRALVTTPQFHLVPNLVPRACPFAG
jgi:hypothetical protein